MALHKSLTTVTPLSKTIAMILFIALPFLGFYLGMQYQELIDSQNVQTVNTDPSAINHPTPSQNSMANWKTYINTQYNLSFKYPETFLLEEVKEKDQSIQLFVRSVKYENPFVDLHFLISTKSEDDLAKGNLENDLKEELVINGFTVHKYSDNYGLGAAAWREVGFFKKNNLTYMLFIGTYDKKNILNQILSTFRFLE